MSVVPPDDRTRLPGTRPAGWSGEPVIRVFDSGTNVIALAEWNIECTFTIFVVAQPMRMHVVEQARAVQKLDKDVVSNFRANDRAKNSQPLRLRLGSGEGIVGVFDEACLGPLVLLQIRLRQRFTGQQIVAAGCIVPGDVFGRYVVMPGRHEARSRQEDKTQSNSSLDLHRIIIPLRKLSDGIFAAFCLGRKRRCDHRQGSGRDGTGRVSAACSAPAGKGFPCVRRGG